MFNRDFYPTPRPVIERMLFGTDIAGRTFLEPSAGKGDIVDYLKENGAKDVITCEINRDLARIAGSKSRLISEDFLNVTRDMVSHVDCIVMNPPFSNEEAHILHAYDVAPDGCTIISLCNGNVVTSRYGTTARQSRIIELIGLYGRTEQFGNCFTDAERETDVRIACVWLYKPRSGDDEFADFFSLTDEEETGLNQQEGIIQYNYVREIVNRYVGAIKLFDRIEPLANEINKLTTPISEFGIKFGAFETGKAQYRNEITRDVYKKELQKQAWQRIFSDMKMQKYVTTGVMEKINRFIETQVHVPFTMRNIYRMVEVIVGTHGSRMGQVLVEAFEKICSFSWCDNCTGGDMWKTNSDYVINRRFIVPYICSNDIWDDGVHLASFGHTSQSQIDDIVKALCFLTGENYDNHETLSSFVNETKMCWGSWYEWGFFNIRGYKKGTMHFEFRDEKVLYMFNRRVAEIRGWRLPGQSNTTKKTGRKSGLVVA